jgi:hypothetical protein
MDDLTSFGDFFERARREEMRAESDWEKEGGIVDESVRFEMLKEEKKGRVPGLKRMRDRMMKGVVVEGILRGMVTRL